MSTWICDHRDKSGFEEGEFWDLRLENFAGLHNCYEVQKMVYYFIVIADTTNKIENQSFQFNEVLHDYIIISHVKNLSIFRMKSEQIIVIISSKNKPNFPP